MANEQNLRPIRKGELSREEAKRRGALGAKASAIARREKRTFKELLELALSQEVTNEKGEVATKKEIIAIKLTNKACVGDLRAIEQLTKLTGEQIVKTEVTGADGKPLIPENAMTLEQLEKEIKRIEQADAK